jgi:cytochrome c oxidase subunit I+III
MNRSRIVDVSTLPPYAISNQSLLWLGQLLMCAIEGSLLCILIAIYFYLRLGVDVWPPPGYGPPPVTLPTIALVPLILSCGGSYWASEAAKKDSCSGMIVGIAANLLLAIVFLCLRAFEWNGFKFTWARSSTV